MKGFQMDLVLEGLGCTEEAMTEVRGHSFAWWNGCEYLMPLNSRLQ